MTSSPSDAMSVNLPAGTQFFIRTAASFSATGLQLMDYPGSGSKLNGEFDSRSTSLNDQTGTPAVLSKHRRRVLVSGRRARPGQRAARHRRAGRRADPRRQHRGGGPATLPMRWGWQGYIQRSLENNVPFVNAARGSTTAAGLALGR